ncbi:MAG TPA: hypothetical protein VLV78_09740 [Thermoanaerobaculia bacterium]|nr:hypothetical protein [Thermoanaerobaculia bacterium]
MATRHHTDEEDDDHGTASRGGRTAGGRRRGGGGAGAGLSTAAILDIVERLGLIDLIVERIKTRLEDVDTDQILDDIADYLKKNPEVLVVSLGAVTIAAGVLVYLNRRK